MTRTFTINTSAQLIEMLTVRRPASSRSERRFIRQYLEPLGLERDGYGNLYKRIGDAPVMWSCHTDTVHHDGGTQLLAVQDDWAGLAAGGNSNCLGADDTAGVWLMCEMIRAERPGLYVFHRCEERGGLGSRYLAAAAPRSRLLDGIACAIALDRRGIGDVITHQGKRCCSDAFAEGLAEALGGDFRPDNTGVFTDTANYVDLIGECTNLSVGYYEQHTRGEHLDLRFLITLRDKLCTLDTRDLPIERKPGDADLDDYYYNTEWLWDTKGMSRYSEQAPMSELVADHPRIAADMLRACGLTASDILAELRDRGEVL